MKKIIKSILTFSTAAAICICSVIYSGAKVNSDGKYVVTCIGDSSPNGSCLGNTANYPNCSPHLGLNYTYDPIYVMDDGTTLVLSGSCNGDKRSNYTFYLEEGISPEEYEENALKAYPVLVAETLNNVEIGSITDFQSFYDSIEYYSMSAATLRSCDILYALDNNYSLNDYLWNAQITAVKREELKAQVDIGAIENSDLVILAFGGNDVFSGPIGNIIFDQSTGIKKILNIINYFKSGIKNCTENYPKIIEELQKRNSDCIYVIVGVYNPLYQYTINDIAKLFGTDIGIFGNFLKVGNTVDLLINKLNTVMQELANKYDNVIYTDSYGTPIWIDELTSGNDVNIPVASADNPSNTSNIDVNMVSGSPLTNGIHPTEDGHEWLARKVLAAVEQIKSEDKNITALDVYGIGEIEKILCDGKAVDYTLSEDGNTAFIEGNGNQTMKVKVSGNNDGVKISREWKCTKSDNGYWTRLISDKT